MSSCHPRRLLFLLLLILLLASSVFCFLFLRRANTFHPWLAVLNVGQGDAIAFSCARGEQWLVDGGPDASVLAQLPLVMPPWDRTIEWLVLTHPHADHVSGLIDVLERYRVEHVVIGESDYATATTEAFAVALQKEGAQIMYPTNGWEQSCAHLFVPEITSSDPNEQSLILRVQIGESPWLLMGDATAHNEDALVARGVKPVYGLKIGHHGSRGSTSDAWLTATKPQWAVISVGDGNDYGHPNKETLTRIAESGARTLRTDTDGTVVFSWEGKPMWSVGVDSWLFPWWLHQIK